MGYLMKSPGTVGNMSVCVLGTWVSCAKMDELIKMPFGGSHVGPKNHVLDEGTDTPLEWALFEGDLYHPVLTYLPPANVRAQCMWQTSAFIAMRGDS